MLREELNALKASRYRSPLRQRSVEIEELQSDIFHATRKIHALPAPDIRNQKQSIMPDFSWQWRPF